MTHKHAKLIEQFSKMVSAGHPIELLVQTGLDEVTIRRLIKARP